MVLRGERILIGNEELLSWMLRPEGMAFLVLAVTLSLMGAVLRYTGIFQVVTDDMEGRQPCLRRVVFSLFRNALSIFRLCLTTAVVVLLLLAPLGACLGFIYFYWLGEHDINYYLAMEPPEWGYAKLSVVAVAVPWALGVGYLVLRSIPALPSFLDGHRPFTSALTRGWQRTQQQKLRLLGLLLFCLGTWFGARIVAQVLLFLGAVLLIDGLAAVSTAVFPLLVATGIYSLGILAVDLVISFVGFSFTSILLTKFYYEETDLHELIRESAPVTVEPEGESRRWLPEWLHPFAAVPLILVLLIASGAISATVLHVAPRPPDFLVTAHRAGAFLGAENTLAALEASIEAGADFAEIDVQRTADGVVVVLHDIDLMRVADDPRRIDETFFADLEGVLQGDESGGPPELRHVATLEEFLEHSQGRIGLNIELKYHGWDPELAPAVIDQVRARNMEEEVVLMSLDLRAVHQVRELAPDLTLGYIASVTLGNLRRLPVDFLALPRGAATPRVIRRANRKGMEVQVWTLNTPEAILEAAQAGAQAIITDDPVLALRIRKEVTDLTPAEQLLLAFHGLIGQWDLLEETSPDTK